MKFGNSGARTKEMQDTITSSLRNMRDAGLDHVILSVIELPEDYAKAIRKDGFIDMAKCRHYSFEKLCP